MTNFRIFAVSLLVTLSALVLGYAYGGQKALCLLVVLGPYDRCCAAWP